MFCGIVSFQCTCDSWEMPKALKYVVLPCAFCRASSGMLSFVLPFVVLWYMHTLYV